MFLKRLSNVFIPLLCVTLQVKVSAETMDSKALSSAVANFSSKFCNELEKNKSVVSSPLSAEYVLALLTLGSTGDVHDELLNSLGIKDDDSIRSSFTAVSSKLKSIKGVTLNVANKVYIMEGPYELKQKLKDDAVKVFDAGFEKVDFANGAEAANLINKWVESKTNERIKDLLSSDSLNSDTRLVLVNALYFKGTWKSQFNSHHTTDRDFHIDLSTTVKVPTMYQEDSFHYGESQHLDAQLLRMPYEGEEASMLVILPRQVDGLNNVLQKLAAGHDLIAELDNMFKTKVKVFLPKFKIETEIDLKVLLPKLGIKGIFDPANKGLSGLIQPNDLPLYVSKAVQKAFIEVNEEGAEAAAATAMCMGVMSAMVEAIPVEEFIADRPHLVAILVDNIPYFYAINHNAMGMVFMSAMVDFDPVQEFIADRPHLVAILVDNIPYFYAINHSGS